jgi:predicted component of type VI protein secretion system
MMQVAAIYALAMIQGGDNLVLGINTRLFLVFTALLVVAVVLQTVILLAMALGARKAQQRMVAIAEDLQNKVTPILDTTRIMVEDAAPKIKVVTSNAVAASYLLREQAEHLHDTVEEISVRARHQVARVDGMVSGAFDVLTKAAGSLQEGVMAPVRQVTGILNGIRAGLDVLRNKRRRDHSEADEDMFV